MRFTWHGLFQARDKCYLLRCQTSPVPGNQTSPTWSVPCLSSNSIWNIQQILSPISRHPLVDPHTRVRIKLSWCYRLGASWVCFTKLWCGLANFTNQRIIRLWNGWKSCCPNPDLRSVPRRPKTWALGRLFELVALRPCLCSQGWRLNVCTISQSWSTLSLLSVGHRIGQGGQAEPPAHQLWIYPAKAPTITNSLIHCKIVWCWSTSTTGVHLIYLVGPMSRLITRLGSCSFKLKSWLREAGEEKAEEKKKKATSSCKIQQPSPGRWGKAVQTLPLSSASLCFSEKKNGPFAWTSLDLHSSGAATSPDSSAVVDSFCVFLPPTKSYCIRFCWWKFLRSI